MTGPKRLLLHHIGIIAVGAARPNPRDLRVQSQFTSVSHPSRGLRRSVVCIHPKF